MSVPTHVRSSSLPVDSIDFERPELLHNSRAVCNRIPRNVTLLAMTTAALSTIRARGVHPKRCVLQHLPREKGCNLPEYLEAPEVTR